MRGMATGCRASARPCRSIGARPRVLAVRCYAGKKIAVLGGTGRVGGSTVSSLLQNPDYEVIVASRSQESFDKAVKLRPELGKTRFQACDITDPASIKARIAPCRAAPSAARLPCAPRKLLRCLNATTCGRRRCRLGPLAPQELLQQVDLVVHAAGPFQRCKHWNVLEAAIETKTPYIDVCDDSEYSEK